MNRGDDFVLLSIPISARRDFVGQDGILRRIVNPPARGNEAAALFAACRYVGQVAKTCGRLAKSACPQMPNTFACGDAALWGSQSWLAAAAFRRLAPTADTLLSAARNVSAGTVCCSCELAA